MPISDGSSDVCSSDLSYYSPIDRRSVMRSRATVKLSAKFQISIPKAVRAARHWQAGQEFAFIPKGEGVILVPVPKREDLAGLARGARPAGYRDRTARTSAAKGQRVSAGGDSGG